MFFVNTEAVREVSVKSILLLFEVGFCAFSKS